VRRSLRRDDGSVICQSHSQQKYACYQYVQFACYMLLNVCIYNKYRASVSPGSVQQILPYLYSAPESGTYITTDGQSANLSWNTAPNRDLRPDFS
jgi:hypothetical protein